MEQEPPQKLPVRVVQYVTIVDRTERGVRGLIGEEEEEV